MKKIISAIVAACVFGSVICAAEEKDTLSLQEITEYKNASDSYGVWSFYATAGYYPVRNITANGYPEDDGNYIKGSGINKDKYKYGDVSDATYYIPVKARWLDSAESGGIEHNGLYFSNEKGYQRSFMLINPNVSDGRVRFSLNGPHAVESKKAGDIGVCFTAPKSGYYKIYHDFENRGGGNPNGGDGIVRRSIMKNGEVMENAENTQDFKFGVFTSGVATTTIETTTEYLNESDRVYIRVSSGTDGWNDNFYGKVIISEVNEDGSIIKEYDLSKVAFSEAENWSFYNAKPEAVNADKYHHMFAYYKKSSAKNVAYSAGADDMSYKAANKSPSFEWKSGEKILVTNGTKSGNSVLDGAEAVLCWTVPEEGAYRLNLSLANHEGNATEGSVVKVSYLEAGSSEDTNILKSIELPASGEEMSANVGGGFKKNDRILIRFTRTDNLAGAKFYVNPEITKLSSGFEAEYKLGENKITSASELVGGGILKIDLKGNNVSEDDKSVQFLTCLYSDGELIGVCASEKYDFPAWSFKAAAQEIAIPEGIIEPELVTYIWSDFNKAIPLCKEIILN